MSVHHSNTISHGSNAIQASHDARSTRHPSPLDYGCGSLCAGRLLIPYLDKGNYVGVEPNRWLIDDALQHEIGHDIIIIKQPEYRHNDFNMSQTISGKFDFMVAQSILSHAGPELIDLCLTESKNVLKDNGLLVVTIIHGDQDFEGDGRIYPGVVAYRPDTIVEAINRSSLFGTMIPWHHPRQIWYVLSASADKIEHINANKHHLTGAVMFVEPFDGSLAEPSR